MARITLEDMKAAGLTDAQIVKVIQESVSRRREYDRQRNRKNKAKSRNGHRFSMLPGEKRGQVATVTNGSNGHDALERKPGESLVALGRRLTEAARQREFAEFFGREVDADRGN